MFVWEELRSITLCEIWRCSHESRNEKEEERREEKMKTTPLTIKRAFGIIGEIFDELSHADRAWNACGWGESVFERIDEAIRTYKREVEKMNEKVEKLERNYI